MFSVRLTARVFVYLAHCSTSSLARWSNWVRATVSPVQSAVMLCTSRTEYDTLTRAPTTAEGPWLQSVPLIMWLNGARGSDGAGNVRNFHGCGGTWGDTGAVVAC